MPTTTSVLLNALWAERYGYPFDDWVADRRDRGISWRKIAREIADLTGVEITHATIRSWFPDLAGTTDEVAA